MTRPCDLCGAPIPLARLAAMPITKLCVECKATHDEPPLVSTSRLVMQALAGIDEEELLKISHG